MRVDQQQPASDRSPNVFWSCRHPVRVVWRVCDSVVSIVLFYSKLTTRVIAAPLSASHWTAVHTFNTRFDCRRSLATLSRQVRRHAIGFFYVMISSANDTLTHTHTRAHSHRRHQRLEKQQFSSSSAVRLPFAYQLFVVCFIIMFFSLVSFFVFSFSFAVEFFILFYSSLRAAVVIFIVGFFCCVVCLDKSSVSACIRFARTRLHFKHSKHRAVLGCSNLAIALASISSYFFFSAFQFVVNAFVGQT